MVFSSITFLYYFLPIMLITYYLTPTRLRNVTLMCGSLVFYFLGEPVFVWLLVFSTVVDYSHSRIIMRYRGRLQAKLALISSITINLSMLAFFKYADFVIENMNVLMGTAIEPFGLSLPIGISFFTFQTMSYTIDVYRDEVPAQKQFLSLATYVTLFPQLIAGPIVRYKTIAGDLVHRSHDYDNFSRGVGRFVSGLGKKVLIANQLGSLVQVMNYGVDASFLSAWISAVGFALQIYFDFSGYSDMAIGLGCMFGFHFPENFNYPYTATSISQFWQRWHMSLGQWFRDYVYIPIGGNRKGLVIQVRNIALVWLLTGLWHGASWNFVLWGIFLGLLIILEKIFLMKWLEQIPLVLRHLYVIGMILVSFVIFANEDFDRLFSTLHIMTAASGVPLYTEEVLYHLQSNGLMILIAIIGATPAAKILLGRLAASKYKKVIAPLVPVACITLMTLVTGYLVDDSFNPFLYFRF